MDAQSVAKEYESILQSLVKRTGEGIEVGMIIEDEVVIVQEEEAALSAIKKVILLDSALMGIVGLQGTTEGTMIMMAIEVTIPQGIKEEIGIAPSHDLTLQSVRMPVNQILVHVQDHPSVALKRRVFQDLILQSTTGKLLIVVVAVEAAVLSRMQVEVAAEVEVVTKRGL